VFVVEGTFLDTGIYVQTVDALFLDAGICVQTMEWRAMSGMWSFLGSSFQNVERMSLFGQM
jgi:hypothetical protein